MMKIDTNGLSRAMRELAIHFHLEDGTRDGALIDPEYSEELTYATLQRDEDGGLWLGLKDCRVLREAD